MDSRRTLCQRASDSDIRRAKTVFNRSILKNHVWVFTKTSADIGNKNEKNSKPKKMCRLCPSNIFVLIENNDLVKKTFSKNFNFFEKKKHTAPTIPVWSPTTVLGRPNPAWLQSSDGIWYIQGGMTVWWMTGDWNYFIGWNNSCDVQKFGQSFCFGFLFRWKKIFFKKKYLYFNFLFRWKKFLLKKISLFWFFISVKKNFQLNCNSTLTQL